MKFLNLKIENFMVIAKGEVKLDDRGLLLIQGVNDSDSSAVSNGSGKSTLVNALCWCIYGETSTGAKGDDVLSTGFEKNCMVRVVIQDDDGETYYITRYRNHKEGKNRLRVSNSSGDLTKGTDKLTQEFVEKLIGASIDVFLASIYASQEKIPNLPGMTDKELKTIIEESAGVNRLTMAYEIVRSRSLGVTTKFDNVVTSLKLKTDSLEEVKDNLSAAKEDKLNWDKERESKLEIARSEIDNAEVEITEISLDLGFGSERECNEFYNDKIQLIKDSMDGLTSGEVRLKDIDKEIAHLNHSISKLEASKDFNIANAKKERDLGLSAKDKIGEPCVTCGKPYCEEDLETIVKAHNAKALDYKEKATNDITELRKLNAELDINLKKKAKIESEKPDVSHLVAEINSLNTAKASHIKQFTILNAAETKLKTLKDSYDTITKEVNPFLGVIERISNQLKSLKDDIAILEDDRKELATRVDLFNRAKSVFSPSGVRNHILTNVTPFLNARTADYLNKFSDGTISAIWSTTELTKKGEVRDKFNIVVSKVGKAKSFALLSGGEKRKVRLATALAVQDLVANRATKDIKLFIGDEIDDALDTAGLERLMGVLETKAREKGTVMIISHKEMKSWFRESITVNLKEDRSYVLDPAITE